MTALHTRNRSTTTSPPAVTYAQAPEGPGEWWWQAACRDRNAEIFFHSDHERGPSRAMRTAKAKAVCATCPVITQCLQHALAQPEPYGIWGGMDEQEREQLLRKRAS